MRKGKKVNLNAHPNYSVTLGTINKDNPKSVYIKMTSWAYPYYNNINDYKNIIGRIDKKIKQRLYNTLDSSKFIKNLLIVDFKMRESKIENGKDIFMSCEINLHQKNPKKPTDEKLIDDAKDMVNKVIYDVLEENPYFNFYKPKK